MMPDREAFDDFGERIRLRPIEHDDLPRFATWLADPEVRGYLRIMLPRSLEEEHRWYERQLELPDAERHLAVDLGGGKEWEHIGGACFRDFDWRNRSAQIDLFIGEKRLWNQGLGTDVTRTLLGFGFSTLNLHRIWLLVFDHDRRGQRVHEKIGFTLEGRQREADFCEGRYRDVLVYSILQREWAAPAAPGA